MGLLKFLFFFLWIRGRMDRCRSRDWEGKEDFSSQGNSWEYG